jgi:hypothetical protein
MIRLQEIIEFLDSITDESHRFCPSTGAACACMGCVSVSPLNITQQHLDMYKSGELQVIAKNNQAEQQ